MCRRGVEALTGRGTLRDDARVGVCDLHWKGFGAYVCVGRCGVCVEGAWCVCAVSVLVSRVVGALECLLCIGAFECVQFMDARCWREV